MQYCQSCGKILNKNNRAKEKNGTLSAYCTFCYRDGSFQHDISCEEMQSMVMESLRKAGIPEFVKKGIVNSIPELERWKENIECNSHKS